MPFYSLTYILPNKESEGRARLLCNKCGAEPTWHRGVADRSDLPIQLRCDNCFNQCAEFLTDETRDTELAQLHERALLMNDPVRIERPKLG